MAEPAHPPPRDIVLACCRDAEDQVGPFIDFHLDAGFDTVCLVDGGSRDATVARILSHPRGDRVRLLVDARPGGDGRRLEYYRLFAPAADRWVFFLEVDERAAVPGGIKRFAASLPADVTVLRLPSCGAADDPSSGSANGRSSDPTIGSDGGGRVAWRAGAEVRRIGRGGRRVEIAPRREHADDRLFLRRAPGPAAMRNGAAPKGGALRASPVVALARHDSAWQCFCVRQRRGSEGHTSHEHLVLVKVAGGLERWDQPVFAGRERVAVRIHSECLFGDVFGGDTCDCGWQLADALEQVERAGEGVIVYLRQEGRGIGLLDKIRSMGVPHPDSFVRNERIGHPGDRRGYVLAARLLRGLGVGSVRLLSGNPRKVAALREAGIDVAELGGRVPGALSSEAAREVLAKVRRGYVYAAAAGEGAHGG